MCIRDRFDTSGLKRQVMGDAEFLAEQLDFFRRFYPNQLAQIREGIELEDGVHVREWAHQLSGSLSAFHATIARDTAKAIEAFGRENQISKAADLRPRLEQQIVELCEAVERLIEEIG